MAQTKLQGGYYYIRSGEDLVGFLTSAHEEEKVNVYSKTDSDKDFCLWEVKDNFGSGYALQLKAPMERTAYEGGTSADPLGGAEVLAKVFLADQEQRHAVWELFPVDGKENTYFIMRPGAREPWDNADGTPKEVFMWTVTEPGKQSKIVTKLGKTATAQGASFTFEKAF
ncbi:hypothetical protein [Streptomyces minutiscleroticus]|uniref:hypothetical protein n=1 Tax=Streptomyces minutiscleroticus TaxID=68238 RepID=UPI00331A3772